MPTWGSKNRLQSLTIAVDTERSDAFVFALPYIQSEQGLLVTTVLLCLFLLYFSLSFVFCFALFFLSHLAAGPTDDSPVISVFSRSGSRSDIPQSSHSSSQTRVRCKQKGGELCRAGAGPSAPLHWHG